MTLPHNHTPTSIAAAESMEGHAPTQRRRIRLWYEAPAPEGAGEAGATRDRAEAVLGLRHQSCGARINELIADGLLVEMPEELPTRTGRPSKVIRARRYVPNLPATAARSMRAPRGPAAKAMLEDLRRLSRVWVTSGKPLPESIKTLGQWLKRQAGES